MKDEELIWHLAHPSDIFWIDGALPPAENFTKDFIAIVWDRDPEDNFPYIKTVHPAVDAFFPESGENLMLWLWRPYPYNALCYAVYRAQRLDLVRLLNQLEDPEIKCRLASMIRSLDREYPELCTTCGEPYGTEIGHFCSNGFHCCRDCIHYLGKTIYYCDHCQNEI